MNHILDLVPELLAGLSFLPCGLYMSFLIYGMKINDPDYYKFWPYIIGIFIAIATGGLLTITKIYYKKYKFHHFYYIIVGNIFFFLTGIFLLLNIKDGDVMPPIYFGIVGHGITYIPAITYINIRAKKDQYRSFKISLCHFWYLFGVAVGLHIQVDNRDIDMEPNELLGLIFVIFTCVLLFLYILNDLLQFTNDYDYKKSLDNDFQRENKNLEILMKKKYDIEPIKNSTWMPPTLGLEQQSVIIENEYQSPETAKEILLIIFSLLSKLRNIWMFYIPFLVLNQTNSIIFSIENYTEEGIWHYYFHIIHWFAFGGMAISIILLLFVNTKVLFIFSSITQIILIIIVTVFFSEEFPSKELHYLFWILFCTIGYGYSIPDINLAELTNLKFNELIFSFGYLMEFLVLGMLHHYALDPEVKMIEGKLEELILPHAIAMIVSTLFMIAIAALIMPVTFKKSLLQVKNMILFSTNNKKNNSHIISPTNPRDHNNFFTNPGFQHEQPQPPPKPNQPSAQPPLNYFPPATQIRPNVNPQRHQQQQQQQPEHKFDYKQIQPNTFLPRPRVGSTSNSHY